MKEVWANPIEHRATLIQAYRGFLGELEPHLSEAYRKYGIGKNERLEVVKWLLCEELWLTFGMVDKHHVRNHRYAMIHSYLNTHLLISLSACFWHYFLVPMFMNFDTEVEVEVDNTGFYIRYYTNAVQPMAQAFKHERLTNQKEHCHRYPRSSVGY